METIMYRHLGVFNQHVMYLEGEKDTIQIIRYYSTIEEWFLTIYL